MAGPITFPDHYVWTATTHSNTGPEKWHNSLDFRFEAGVVHGPEDSMWLSCLDWLAGLMRNDCTIVEHSLRIWSRGTHPYFSNPAIWVAGVSHVGNAYSAGAFSSIGGFYGAPILGEVCVRLLKTNDGSALRASSLFIRNCLRDTDVTSTAGGPPLWLETSSDIPKRAQVDTWTTTTLGPLITTTPPYLANIHYSAKHAVGPLESRIASITCLGPTMRDTTHSALK